MDRGGYARAHLVLDLHSCKIRAVLLSELFLQGALLLEETVATGECHLLLSLG